MENIQLLFNQPNIRLINHIHEEKIFNTTNNALASFAIDDAIATTVGNELALPTMRFWVHDKTIVLGIPDSRLPHLQEGLNYIKNLNYNAVIRNSGGLAVLLNQGVLNISLILPNNNALSIHDGYDRMYYFIQELFKQYTNKIKAYEIVGSYCPGEYDLSIDGIKFAGISQRRIRNGVAIQIYIDIEGSSLERAKVVKDFYHYSKQGVETKIPYPDVNPNVMGTISELVGKTFTVNGIIKKIKHLFSEFGIHISSEQLHPAEEDIFLKRLEQMHKRNEKIKRFNP